MEDKDTSEATKEELQINFNTCEEYECIWLGMEMIIPDKSCIHDPEELEGDLRNWLTTFLEGSGQNVDFHETGEGVDLRPRDGTWSNTPVFIRYKDESWHDLEDSKIGKKRVFMVWFPVSAFIEHHELNALKEKSNYLIGDEVYEKYGEELEVRGILIAGSEKHLRENLENNYESQIRLEDHI